MKTSAELDRLAPRARPDGPHVMEQTWENLLFLHWAVEPRAIRALIPPELEIDTFDDQAWIGVTPFALTGLRLLSLPPVPGLDSFLELNVRTYVHYRGVPGVWFFSLDASKAIPAMAARVLFALPYFRANMDFASTGSTFRFHSKRVAAPYAHFSVQWRTGMRLREPALSSLAFFLVERYCLFTGGEGMEIATTRVYHAPWILDEAIVEQYESSMLKAAGLMEPDSPPLAHFARSQHVQVWAPKVL